MSVRSGAKFSMPGMMDTVLNLGLHEASVEGLAAQTGGDTRFARDAYRRFIQMFGKIVMDVPADAFEHALDEAKAAKYRGAQDTDLDAEDLSVLIERFKAIYREHTGADFPTDPKDQLRLAIDAVFRSWNGKRARDYRRQNKISDDLGTAVNVQSRWCSATAARTPAPGWRSRAIPRRGSACPRRLSAQRARGGRRCGYPQHAAACRARGTRRRFLWGLRSTMDTLEKHYGDMCDIEFTIEKGRLWILQTRVGKRTAFAEWVMAADMLDEGLIDEDAALQRVDANRLEELFKPRVAREAKERETPIGKGLNASPGAAIGAVVFSADEAERWAKEDGAKVILVRRETTPDDYHGMIASQGILTSAGGTNSHAAVVARGEGIPAVCGADRSRSTLMRGPSCEWSRGSRRRLDHDRRFRWLRLLGELPLEESALEPAPPGRHGRT